MELMKPEKSVLEELAKISTPNISDALDRLKIRGGLEGILPVVDGVKMIGTAFTVRFIQASAVELEPWQTYIDSAQPGDVIVIDNGGRTYCTVWGGLLSITAKQTGITGTVIDGVCRDVHIIREIKYPVFSKGRFMMTGKDRVQLAEVNGPVTISNVLVRPGDVVVGDDSGVVVVPAEKAAEVARAAREIQDAEEAIEQEVRRGTPLSEARRKHKYGELQRAKG